LSAQWYVLSVKAHKEPPVHRYLQTQKIKTYYPTMRVNPVNPRARRERPYFPGYMFVHVDLDLEGDNRMRWIPGTRGLVRFGDRPAAVPENLIQTLHRQLQAFQQRQADAKILEKGDRVRIIKGPFEGYEAIFDAHVSGKDRVQVLMAYLNHHSRRLRISAHHLEKIT